MIHQRNFLFLCDQLKFAGFGSALSEALKKQLESGEAAFSLVYEKYVGSDQVTAVLYFRKSERSELFFFVSFELSVESSAKKEVVRRLFPVHKNKRYTLREAYNLLSGRAVQKHFIAASGKRYTAWTQLSPSAKNSRGDQELEYFFESYGFDLAEALRQFPLLELESEEQRNHLVARLANGDRGRATLMAGEFSRACFLEADPKFRSFRFFDTSMQPIPLADIPAKGTGSQPAPAPPEDPSPEKPPKKKEGKAADLLSLPGARKRPRARGAKPRKYPSRKKNKKNGKR